MKKIILFFASLLTADSTFAGSYDKLPLPEKETNKEITKEQARSWMLRQPVKFLENKGQMVNSDYKPVSFVLFRASSPGMDAYITENGLTYVFVKGEEKNKEIDTRQLIDKEEENKEKVRAEYSRAIGKQEKGGEENVKTEMAWVNMHLKGASIKKENIIKEGESAEHFNYFYGHCPEGIYDVRQYEKITIKEVYPGIDWVFYSSSKTGMKYDFVVHPGADYNQIKLIYESENPLTIDPDGNINIKTPLGTLTENAPYSYLHETYVEVECSFTKTIIDQHNVGISFNFASHSEYSGSNLKASLVIDPQLVWATIYGGNGLDGLRSIVVDNGSVYVVGYSSSSNYPIQTRAGAYNDAVWGGAGDVIILQFTNIGILSWATYYGGSNVDDGYSIAVDGSNNVYVTGNTRSTDFPLQAWAGAYNDPTYGGGVLGDAFILRFTNTGVRIWATYYGGNNEDRSYSIAIDGGDNVYITGLTSSTNFPIQNWVGAYNDATYGGGFLDAFILRFTNTGALTWATYYGGSGFEEGCAIAIDGGNNVYVTGRTTSPNFPLQPWTGAYNDPTYGGGWDAFVLRFTNTGARTWATFYGGNSDDEGWSVAIDGNNNVYVTGWEASPNFPLTIWAGAYNQTLAGSGDAFILRFTSVGFLIWATCYGGSKLEIMSTYDNIAIDFCGNVFVSFRTFSTDILTFGNASCEYYDASYNGGISTGDIFLIKFSNTGALLWATYFGGDGEEYREAIALDNFGNLFVTGEWINIGSINPATYPLTDPGGGTYFDATFNGLDDGYIVKFIPSIPSYNQSQLNSTTCAPCNGSATINISCGEPNYNYTWSNGNSTLNSSITSNTITGLCPGSYTVTAASNCNQTQTTSFIITGTSCSSVTAQLIGPCTKMCSGNCQTVLVNVNGGTPPYTYNWTPNIGNGSGPYSVCPLISTQYSCIVTDVTGVTANAGSCPITIFPDFNSLSTNSSPATCGSNNGTGTASTSGGTPAYNYTWSNGATGATIIGLSPGTYVVTVIDANGCTKTDSSVISSPPPLIGQFTKGTANCSGCGCKEWIMINATGGTSPYTYLWPDGYVNRYKNQLCPGTYNINIKDKNGCSVNVNLTAP
ncbi:MAG: SBBP repeat-containing protein [Bacteroidetes bacterium]|nr:SBBP repeat-containing protein [Bacteroidota bacterium]